jgi:hypothetical protein
MSDTFLPLSLTIIGEIKQKVLNEPDLFLHAYNFDLA